jgi:hypothetical protein
MGCWTHQALRGIMSIVTRSASERCRLSGANVWLHEPGVTVHTAVYHSPWWRLLPPSMFGGDKKWDIR